MVEGIQQLFCWCSTSIQYLTNRTVSITQIGLKSQMLCMSLHDCLPVMVNSNIPCLLIVSPGIGLKWCSQCFNNLSGIYAYPYICTSAVKYPKQNQCATSGRTSCQYYTLTSLLLRPAKTLLHDAFGFQRSFLQLPNKKMRFISL